MLWGSTAEQVRAGLGNCHCNCSSEVAGSDAIRDTNCKVHCQQELIKTRDVEITRLGARERGAPDLDMAALQFRAEAHEGIIISLNQQAGQELKYSVPSIWEGLELPHAVRLLRALHACNCMPVLPGVKGWNVTVSDSLQKALTAKLPP